MKLVLTAVLVATLLVVAVRETDDWRAWVLDNESEHCHRFRNPEQYEGAVVTSSGATAGCASAPRWFMRKLRSRLDQDRRPLIAIGS